MLWVYGIRKETLENSKIETTKATMKCMKNQTKSETVRRVRIGGQMHSVSRKKANAWIECVVRWLLVGLNVGSCECRMMIVVWTIFQASGFNVKQWRWRFWLILMLNLNESELKCSQSEFKFELNDSNVYSNICILTHSFCHIFFRQMIHGLIIVYLSKKNIMFTIYKLKILFKALNPSIIR